MNGHTVTALRRWSCQDKPLPSVGSIRHIHIYDFDNTLFASPLPNKQLWAAGACGNLQGQDFLHNGGWWHNPRILAATGQGADAEELRAWEGFWNEKIVELVQLSMTAEDTVTVLITGRMEKEFSDLINRMIRSKGLEFDMVCLKPTVSPSGELFKSTMDFKQILLRDIVYTYAQAYELRIYEDRPKHTKGFRDFFEEFNRALKSPNSDRSPITAEVIQVSEQEASMDPVHEAAEVQAMINDHNQAILDGTAPPHSVPYKIKRSVFYTGYMLGKADIDHLKKFVQLPAGCPEHEVRHLANNILITPRPAPRSILDKVGGLGAKQRWRVTDIGVFDHKIWAAKVQPVPANARIYTENSTPYIVLATRKQTKPAEASRISQWQRIPDANTFEIETVVGEKVLLRVEQEYAQEDAWEASFPNGKNARKHPREEDLPPLGSSQKGPKAQQRGNHYQQEGRQPNSSWAGKNGGGGSGGGIGFASQRGGGRGGSRGGRGGDRGYRGGNRGRGGSGRGGPRGGYRSLDDNVGQGSGSGGMNY